MQNDRKSYALRMLLISSKIFIFRKVTVDLLPIMEKIDAILEVLEILSFGILLRLSLCLYLKI